MSDRRLQPIFGYAIRMHCVPIDDELAHAAQVICWCHPVETEPGIWAHNAKDCREVVERIHGTGIHGKPWYRIPEYHDPRQREDPW